MHMKTDERMVWDETQRGTTPEPQVMASGKRTLLKPRPVHCCTRMAQAGESVHYWTYVRDGMLLHDEICDTCVKDRVDG